MNLRMPGSICLLVRQHHRKSSNCFCLCALLHILALRQDKPILTRDKLSTDDGVSTLKLRYKLQTLQ